MTSRMEFRNYRSSAQLVHCNIQQKRYNHFPENDGKIHCAEDRISADLLRHVARHIIVSERFPFALEQLKICSDEYCCVEYDWQKEEERNLQVFFYTFHLLKHVHSNTSNCQHFGCPVICTDIYSECYFVH